MLNIFLISISVSMDCFAVSIAGGANEKRIKITNLFKMAFFFGLFQAVMPVIGWFIGYSFKNYIERFDHWIAFALLVVIGMKMIMETFKDAENRQKINLMNFSTILFLSIATSIDALAIGISFSILNIPLYLSVAIIGIFAFMFSIVGYFIGNKLGEFLENKVEIVGGILLIAIGVKILIEHLVG